MFSQRKRLQAAVLAFIVCSLLAVPVAAGAQTPANGITSPADGAKLSGVVTVKGYANDAFFAKWQLDVLPGGVASAAIFLAFGTTAGDFTYTLDTTTSPPGNHVLRLRVVRTDGNYSEYLTKFSISAATAAAPAAAAPAVSATRPVTPTVSATRPVTPTVSTTRPVTPTTTAPAAAAAPVNGITSPADGAKLSGVVTIKGYANDPNFARWQLDVLPGGVASAAMFLTVGTPAGVFTATLDSTALPPGNHVLRLRVVRNDGNYSEYFTRFSIGAATAAAPAATAPVTATRPVTPTVSTTRPVTPTTTAAAPAAAPVNGITSPADGAKLSGVVTVKGYANDPNFARWQLDVLPGGVASAAIFLAVGTPAGVFTATLDSATLPPGNHALRLRVVRNDGNYSEYFTKFTR